nr:uncharacterized protein K02A2.6-like [Quercus suber]
MSRIKPSVMVHRLNVSPSFPPVHQKKRVFAQERDQAIAEEVNKLKEAGFIRKVYYPDWLANVVMVKKANGKWRMCVDFIDLNKACPKDSYPFPKVDILVDSTAQHQLLSFMDAFSCYNQIQMDEANQEKTSFVNSQSLFCYKVMPFGLKNAGTTYQKLMNKMFANQTERNVQVYIDDMLAIELSEFDIQYCPRTAIKGQVVVDFIAKFTNGEDNGADECPKWSIHIDGLSNKQARGLGVVLLSPEGDKIECMVHLDFPTTNNEAKYEALVVGLDLAKAAGATSVVLYCDSQVVTNQMNEDYECNGKRMKKYLEQVRRRVDELKAKIIQIPKGENEQADRLAKAASVEHIATLDNEISSESNWTTPLVSYVKNGVLPDRKETTRKLKVQEVRFVLMKDILYKIGFSRPYLRCLGPGEADYVMREVHEGICGNHSRSRSLVHKLVRAKYYWPTMQKDAQAYVKACDKCQKFSNIIRQLSKELTSITAPWPFAQWRLDIIGPFPIAMRQLKFLIVGIDYFTKWVKAEALAIITEKNVRSFVWRFIVCRFRIPRVLVLDNRKQFDNDSFWDFCSQLGIKNHYSSPAHLQANEQVEVTNQSLLKIIKTRLEGVKGIWPEELPSILWAYRTTSRTPIGETPFRLIYRSEVVIPAEVELTSYRVNNHDERKNDEAMHLQLDLVEEVRVTAEQRFARYQDRIAKHYNSQVRHRDF